MKRELRRERGWKEGTRKGKREEFSVEKERRKKILQVRSSIRNNS